MDGYKDDETIIGKKFSCFKLSTGFKIQPKKSDVKEAVQQLLVAYNIDPSKRTRVAETEIAVNAMDMVFGNFDALPDHKDLIPGDIFPILVELCGVDINSIKQKARQCVLHMLIATNVFEINFFENGLIPFCISLINSEEEDGRKNKIKELNWCIQALGCMSIANKTVAKQISLALPLEVLLSIVEDYPEIADEASAYTSLLLNTLKDQSLCISAIQIFGIFYDKGKEKRRAAAIDGLATCISLWDGEFPVGIFNDYKLFKFVEDCFCDDDEEDYVFINRRAAEVYLYMARLGYMPPIQVENIYQFALSALPNEAVLNIIAFKILTEMVRISYQSPEHIDLISIISQEFLKNCLDSYDVLPVNTKKAFIELIYMLCDGKADIKIFLLENHLFEILSDELSNGDEINVKKSIFLVHDLVQFVIRMNRIDLLQIAAQQISEYEVEELQSDDEEIAFKAQETLVLIERYIHK